MGTSSFLFVRAVGAGLVFLPPAPLKRPGMSRTFAHFSRERNALEMN